MPGLHLLLLQMLLLQLLLLLPPLLPLCLLPLLLPLACRQDPCKTRGRGLLCRRVHVGMLQVLHGRHGGRPPLGACAVPLVHEGGPVGCPGLQGVRYGGVAAQQPLLPCCRKVVVGWHDASRDAEPLEGAAEPQRSNAPAGWYILASLPSNGVLPLP